MGLVSEEVVSVGFGHVYAAPVGTDFPASIADAVDLDDWADLGYCNEDGVKFEFGNEVNKIPAWQSFDPVRIIKTAVPKKVSFTLLQWNQHTLLLGLGGGDIDEGDTGEYTYEPPDPSFVDTRAFIIEGVDGEKNYRFCYRKGLNTAGVEFSFVRANAVEFPIAIEILAADGGGSPFFIQTDDINIGELNEAGS